MQQPDFLTTDKLVPWAWGKGNDVWGMFRAAAHGELAELERLVARDETLTRCLCSYRAPLHFAVRENQIEAAEWLIQQGADATYVSGQDWHDSPLQMARDRGYVELAKRLEHHLQERFGIGEAGEQIAAAIRQRDTELAQSLVAQHGPHVADQRGNQPIHWAVMTRQTDLIRYLLKNAANINAMRPDGARPLDLTNGDYWYRGWRDSHDDAVRNHWVIAGFLMAKGADYDLTTACRIGDMARVRELVEADPGLAYREPDYITWYSGYALRSAVAGGYSEIVKFLLLKGFDPNFKEQYLAPHGASLYEAVATKHRDLIELLLGHNANPNQEVESSGSCLYRADAETQKLLRKHGAIWDFFGCCYEEGHVEDLAVRFQRDPSEANDAGAFAMVASRGDREMADLFLEYESDLWKRMPTSAGNSGEVFRWMLEQGMQLDQPDWQGVHALHYATDIETMSRLLDAGAEIDHVDAEHQSTPLGWAARRGNVPIVQFLLDRGADPKGAGAEWAQPREWALRRGHTDVAELLNAS